MQSNPVLVEVVRGDAVESRHCGAWAVVDSGGSLIASAGDIDRACFARSAIKPLQAIAFVESGAMDRYELNHQHVALSSASHNGEVRHTKLVGQWLTKLGLSERDLECGGHYPYHLPSRDQLVREGVSIDATHNNCSGKHCGMLSTARALNEVTQGYIEPDHPVQRRIRQILAEMTDTDLSNAPVGVDGCGIPVTGISLTATAYAMARFADPTALGEKRAASIRIIHDAVTQDPFLVAGTDRFCTNVMQKTGSSALVKTGAEGFFCAALPQAGLGIALKIDDGASRASETAMASLLAKLLAAQDPELATALRREARRPVSNVAGRVVGELRAVLPDAGS